MAYFPNSNHTYPAYAAGYPANPVTSPWPTPTINPTFAPPNQNTRPPMRYPTAINAYPPASPISANHWYSAATDPQQPMVISLNAPKLSAEDLKKNFWLKVAATTTSIVAGLGIATYFGMKILPQRIAVEMGHQLHKAMLSNTSEQGIEKLLSDIKGNTLTLDNAASEELKKAWSDRKAAELYHNKQDLPKFLAAIAPHTSISKTGGLTGQDILRSILTKDFMDELWNERIQLREQVASAIIDLKELMLSEADQGKLVALAQHHPNIKALLKNQKFSDLPKEERAKILQEVCKILPLSDSISLLFKESTGKTFDAKFKQEQVNSLLSTLKGQLLNKELLAEAEKSESVKEALKKLAPNSTPQQAQDLVLENISIQDALALLARSSVDKTLAPEYLEAKTQEILGKINQSIKDAPFLARCLSSFFLPKPKP